MLMPWLVDTFGSGGAYGITVIVGDIVHVIVVLFEMLFS